MSVIPDPTENTNTFKHQNTRQIVREKERDKKPVRRDRESESEKRVHREFLPLRKCIKEKKTRRTQLLISIRVCTICPWYRHSRSTGLTDEFRA